MLWYDQLNDKQRAKVLAFLLGYIHGTSTSNRKSIRTLIEKEYAEKLLKLVEQFAYEEMKS